MKTSLLTTITAALAVLVVLTGVLTGCGSSPSAEQAKKACDAAILHASKHSGSFPPSAAELTTYAGKKGVTLAYPVVDIKETTWQQFSQKPRPAIGNGALKNLIGYYVDQDSGQVGICTETETLTNKESTARRDADGAR
jgi:hypothetical protein